MKDLPHHIKKLNRQVLRSAHREELEEELPEIPHRPVTKKQEKKKKKLELKEKALFKPSSKPTLEERNRIMKSGRVPIFDRNSSQPKHAGATKKKTPRI